jgi:hypothetical protein
MNDAPSLAYLPSPLERVFTVLEIFLPSAVEGDPVGGTHCWFSRDIAYSARLATSRASFFVRKTRTHLVVDGRPADLASVATVERLPVVPDAHGSPEDALPTIQ